MNLTNRQTEVVERLAIGANCEDIAIEFNRSVLTIRTHVKQACERLEAKNIANLVAISIRRGLICLVAVAMLTGTDDAMRRSGKTRIARRADQVQMIA